MLNDYLISNDAVGYVISYIESLDSKQRSKKPLIALEQQIRQYASQSSNPKPSANLVSYEVWWGLLDELASITNNQSVGIEIGASIKTTDCGLIGYLFRTSQNILAAFSSYQRYERLLYTGSEVHTRLGSDKIWLSWDPQNGLSTQQSDALLLAALVNVLRDITESSSLHPIEVKFTQQIEASALSAYEKFFRCPITTVNERLEIGFQLEPLSKTLPHWDQGLHELLEQQAKHAIKSIPEENPWITKLKKHLTQMLQEGDGSAAELSRRIGVSERSLHRQLNQQGVLYRDLLRSLRKALVQHYLSDHRLSLSEIALMLGYSEQSAFNRSFKTWYDQTPLQARKEISQQREFHRSSQEF